MTPVNQGSEPLEANGDRCTTVEFQPAVQLGAEGDKVDATYTTNITNSTNGVSGGDGVNSVHSPVAKVIFDDDLAIVCHENMRSVDIPWLENAMQSLSRKEAYVGSLAGCQTDNKVCIILDDAKGLCFVACQKISSRG